MSQKKLTIRFTAKNLRAVCEKKAQETATAPCLNVKSDSKLKLTGFSNKRKPELVHDVPEGKRRKMDQLVKRHCSNILKELLSHRCARIFSLPVDPVALRIPDYFSIISDPMDLGTIKSKLEENLYFSSDEFAADVSLTFSNAMLYNPPNSSAHQYARELDHYFKRRWKNQLASRNHQNKGVGLIRNGNGSGLNTQDSAESAKKLKADSNSANLMPAKKKVNGLNSLSGKGVRKGACNLVNSKQSLSSVSPLCGLCRGVPCQCGHQKSKIPTSNDKSLKEVNTKFRYNDRKVLLSQKSMSYHNSEGPLMDGEPVKKALRVAKLKCRFVDTIAKANGGKVDLSKIHEERERLERLQREDADKICRQRKEEKKMIIEKKRQAARLALEEMERTVEVENKLEYLTQRSLADFSRGFGVSINKRTFQFRRPVELRGLGLVLKEADADEELFLNEEREEGEISP